MNQVVKCNYCGNDAEMVSGDKIFQHRSDLSSAIFYRCAPCEAYIGSHPNTNVPTGRLANAELRVAKMRAHDAFDALWKTRAPKASKSRRAKAWAWLADRLGIVKDDCHIGLFDIGMCNKVVQVCDVLEGV